DSQYLVRDRMADVSILTVNGKLFAPPDSAFFADIGVDDVIVAGDVAVTVEAEDGAGRPGIGFKDKAFAALYRIGPLLGDYVQTVCRGGCCNGCQCDFFLCTGLFFRHKFKPVRENAYLLAWVDRSEEHTSEL